MKEKPLPTYEDRASHAAQRLTDEYVRRWRRIKSNPETTALFEELMELSRRIPDAQVAVDVFEHVAAIRKPQIIRTPGKRPGSNDPDGDEILLFYYDRARNRELPCQLKPWSKAMLAKQLAGERWGTESKIVRRLKRLINERNKRSRGTV